MEGHDNTIEREFGAYKSIKDNYPKYVISLDKIDLSRDGIIHLNLIDFLLSEEFWNGVFNLLQSVTPGNLYIVERK